MLLTIQYAIMGLLSWKPLSGYDLKKIMADSDIFYWSGNNNQIYKSLIQLHNDGLVTQQVQVQDSLPAKKIYTITSSGEAELRQWVLSTVELPDLRNTFLIQLAGASTLSEEELDVLLARHEEEIAVQLLMRQEQARRPAATPDRTAREAYLWKKIGDNILTTYQKELDWVRQVRSDLKENRLNGLHLPGDANGARPG